MMLLLATAVCVAVGPQADKVVARDLASEFPALAAAPADALVAFAPGPGTARTFSVPELARIASRFGITVAPEHEVCVERRMSVLRQPELLEAMRAALPEAEISIADFSRIPAPEGRIEFRLPDLRAGSKGESYWRGAVLYAGGRRFPIWARVMVTVMATRVKAIGDLPAGKPIEAGLVSEDTGPVFPSAQSFAKSAEQVVGRSPRVAIRAGAAIRLDELEPPKDVSRGDSVRVVVASGAARLEFDAVALGSGSVGARIEVRNPDSNKAFLARVEGKDRVSVDALPRLGNQ
jgi:flagella basal body P-ring formation protein FlgA